MFDTISLYNPWWTDSAWKQGGIPRYLFNKLFSSLSTPYITTLKGPRQTGKTFLIKQLIQNLIKEGTSPNNIYYFLFDDPALIRYTEENPNVFINFLNNTAKERGKLYVFLDEFQKVEELSNIVKLLYEVNAPIKFFLSGSSTLKISEKTSESLMGRTQTFILLPFSFGEFVSVNLPSQFPYPLKDLQDITKTFINSPEDTFQNWQKLYQTHKFVSDKIKTELLPLYLQYGGYPQVIISQTEKFLRLKEIKQAYIEKDIINLLKIEKIKEFEKTMESLSLQIGSTINYSSLQRDIGIPFQTLKKFLNTLESTYLIGFPSIYASNKISSIKKMPKIYFSDIGLRNLLSSTMESPQIQKEIGPLTENFLYTQLLKYNHWLLDDLGKIFFWRSPDGNEIDFLLGYKKELLPIEIKYQQGHISPTRGIQIFAQKEIMDNFIILTPDLCEKRTINNKNYYFLPLHIFALGLI